ncbi:hypothetical protein NCAS_0C05930 [Naumovozyma castellii]|uniref:Uncharacterized protein n=1 Tax=Naumovozyma castellii TaxID=27288 RepID=G0VDM1_NAUCA|nr:hypothetical protein NCAS_0C05930 [Naumovozyma castellii CBS 4309]CCC69583.1 hypothetical protein NCAS_0C05930 [Naumovozyma castellii CBS 4309]
MSFSSNSTGSCPFWNYDDITECGRAKYIGFDLPLVISISSLCFVSYNVWFHFHKYNQLHIKKRSLVDELLYNEVDPDENESQPLLSSARPNDGSYTQSVTTNDLLREKHFSIENIKFLKLDGTKHGEPQILQRSYNEKLRTTVELLLLLVQCVLHFFFLLKFSKNDSFDLTFRNNFTNVVLWLILAIICTVRWLNINETLSEITKYAGNLWSISFTSYLILFISTTLPFRSIYIHHIEDLVTKRYYLSQFYANLSLFLLLFTSKVGNNLPIIYKTDETITPSPEPTSSVATFISWSWIDPFVWKAHKTSLEFKDIWGLKMDDYSIFVVKGFKRFIKTMNSKKTFTFQLLSFFLKYFLLQGFWACLEASISFIPTILLKRILEYVEDQSSAPLNLAWFYVSCMFLCRFLVAVCQGQALFFGRRVCVRMRSIIISEIYSKALRRKITSNSTEKEEEEENQAENHENPLTAIVEDDEPERQTVASLDESKKSANLGAIINLMAVDAFKVSEICGYLHFFVEAVIMVFVAITLLYKLLGYAAFVGAALIIACLPLNLKLATFLGKLQKESLGFTDKRIQKLNETLQAIRIIKFFSWEDNFSRDIKEVREKELHLLLKRSLIWAFSSFVWFVTPSIVTSASFAFYIYVQGEVLTTPVAFTALSLFTLLKTPLDQLSNMISFVIQSKVSLDRIQDFLGEQDTDKYNQLTIDKLGNRIAFKNVTVTWDNGEEDFKLRDLNIEFKPGALNVVIGPTGSGKTSLLLALLGEMCLEKGEIIVPALNPRQDLVIDKFGLTNSIAYCSQAAWLLNETVRNNILFNSPYNEERYNAVIDACGLRRDLKILKASDMTEIGEKGITLSGGQKQRVSLARALYSNSKHVLLDDCLSAVDSHTALWIYDNCITGPLMSGRTCILVSHNIALTLKNAELVVILENGRVKDQGTPLVLLNKGLLGDDDLIKSNILSRTNSSVNVATPSSTNLVTSQQLQKNDIADPQANEELAKNGKLVEEETKAEGVVSIQVYKWYLTIFGGWKTVSLLGLIFITTQMVFIAQSWWVRAWVSRSLKENLSVLTNGITQFSFPIINAVNFKSVIESQKSSINTVPDYERKPHSTFYYLSIYFLIGLTQSLLAASKSVLNFVLGIRASRKIFESLLYRTLHAKLGFFDATPIGRIMNRFSKDIESVDQELTPYLEAAFFCLVQCIATMALITFITPQFLSVAILVGCLYYLVGYFYMAASRELKRFESISKSPIYQHFSETLVGVATIRAYGDESRFMLENLHKIDENNKPFFYLWVFNRWLSFRIDMIGAFVIFGAGVFILTNIKNIDSGMAGISLTYAISFTEGALWLVRFYADVEMNMNSVERLKEYMEIEQEPYDEYKDTLLHDEWPSNGKIEVKDLSLRYAPNLPKVIKNVSFVVEPKTKIGIVGRTGAGKSTIITAMFRFLNPESGYIKIDDVNIASINLTKLRRSITIIPQDPTLFTGTIKLNLDPYNEFTDDAIFEALKRVNLVTEEELQNNGTQTGTSENANKFLNLENEITEGGSNLSHGQRQLVCLARSLLRNPKIILLDEATASIDYASDAKIQETIRKEFSQSTILTIAHRLRSVIDYDKIIVMDAGEVKEYDHPYSLLLDKNSNFYSMCEQSGELETLIEMAKAAFVEKLNAK